jgi:hypothetical protein
MRLSHNGRRGRDKMSPREQAEWDSLGFKGVSLWPEIDQDEARLRYLEVTQGSD